MESMGLRPGGRIAGDVAVPGSKSLAQRALVLAALCGGRTRVTGIPDGDDARRALALIAAAGARVERLAPAAVAVDGRPPGPHRGWSAGAPLDAGESGTLARLSTAALALCGTAARDARVEARGTLRARRSPALFAALRAAGVRTDPPDADGWPVALTPVGPPSTLAIDAPSSSQEVSALLCALAAYPGEHDLEVRGAIPSRPYLTLTIATLARFGVAVRPRATIGVERFTVAGPLRAPEAPLAIEADASAAAVALAAGCLSGGEVRVRGIPAGTHQGDARVVEHLAAFGCDAGRDDAGLWARGAPARGVELDLSGEPDLAPVLAAVAARAALAHGAASRLTGLDTLPGKESSRIEVLAGGLRAVGLEARATDRALEIRPGRGPVVPHAPLDPRGDHRMAFAFALLGLCVEGVLVSDPRCVAKSWPDFWTALERAGAAVGRSG